MSRQSTWQAPMVLALVVLVAAGIVLAVLQRRIAGSLLAFGGNPQVVALLEASRDDQRALASRDPSAAAQHRQRFGEIDTLLRRLRILDHNRDAIVVRYREILFGLSMLVVGLMVGTTAVRQSRRGQRLAKLQAALGDLTEGRGDIRLGPPRRDLIGQIERMVEQTSRVMARDRRRLAALRNLSAWQEAARRHAHEMRTPLTGARLELARLEDLALVLDRTGPEDQAQTLRHAAHSALQELERLRRFTQAFTSFARLPRLRPVPLDLRALATEFASTFAQAWPGVRLVPPADGAPVPVSADRDQLRQVLVNLCDNAAQAMGDRGGCVRLTLVEVDGAGSDIDGRPHHHPVVGLDVADDGPGVDAEWADRLFEPYTTTRGIGEGMGLGLAISRKLMLDHDGELELHMSSGAGATFRLTLPSQSGVLPEDESPNGGAGEKP